MSREKPIRSQSVLQEDGLVAQTPPHSTLPMGGLPFDRALSLGISKAEAGQFEEARFYLEKARALSPHSLDVLFNLAHVLRSQGDIHGSIALFSQALESDPSHGETLFGLGEALFSLKKWIDAAVYLRRALALLPKDPEVALVLGLCLLQMKSFPESEVALSYALSLHPDWTSAHFGLFSLYFEWGRYRDARRYLDLLEKTLLPLDMRYRAAYVFYVTRDNGRARTLVDQAIKDGQGERKWLHLSARLYRDLGDFGRAIEAFRLSLERHGPSGEAYEGLARMRALEEGDRSGIEEICADGGRENAERASAFFARYFMGEGSAEDRFSALSKAHELIGVKAPLDPVYDLQTPRLLTSLFCEDFFKKHGGEGFPKEGPLFILGMPRSGTTLVEQILAAHPQVFPGGERSDVLDLMEGPGYIEGLSKADQHTAFEEGKTLYQSMFKGAEEHTYATDKLPDNYRYIGFLAWVLPAARFVYCRRCPEDNALSLYEQNFGLSVLPYAGDLEACGVVYREHERLMAHWKSLFRERIFEVDHDALVHNPEPIIRELLAFLNLPWNQSCLSPEDVVRPISTASVWRVRQSIDPKAAGRSAIFKDFLMPFTRTRGAGNG